MAEDYDPHCKAVYDWETSWPEWNTETLTLAQCRELIALACTAYGLEPPAVRQHDPDECDMAYSVTNTPPDGSFISFIKEHKNKAIALHEAAHYITDCVYGSRCQAHGPTWQGIYFHLLANAEIAPLAALKASLRPFGLHWHTITPEQANEKAE